MDLSEYIESAQAGNESRVEVGINNRRYDWTKAPMHSSEKQVNSKI